MPESNPDIVYHDSLPPTPTTDSGDQTVNPALLTDAEATCSGDSAWREELATRLNRFRSRRKIRPPRYPSPRLPFDAFDRSRSLDPIPSHANFEPLSEFALTLNGAAAPSSSQEVLSEESVAGEAAAAAAAPNPENVAPPNLNTGKIIEFPRFAWAPPPPPPDQLAEPVIESPRILEVPEEPPPPPALGGITIEPAQLPNVDKQPGIDFPVQSASLTRRLFAFILDGLIIAGASTLFGFIFFKIAGLRPPMPQLIALTTTVPVALWAIYHYILVVYGARTPGLLASGLELTRFDGTHTTRSLRRWRVLASYLSAISLGMGYAWLFLDEDALCWHDRITRTYLAPKGNLPKN